MKVIWDHQAFSFQRAGGVSRSFAELLPRLDSNIEIAITPHHGNNVYLSDSYKQRVDPTPDFRGKIKLKKTLNNSLAKQYLETNTYDILHATFYETYHLSVNKKPLVVTIHDTIHEDFSAELPDREKKVKAQKRQLIERADAIICVSNATLNGVIKHYPNTSKNKLHVISHGHEHVPEIKDNSESNPPYLLHVGLRNGYKNFDALLHALSRISDSKMELICFGGGSFSAHEKRLIRSLSLDHRVTQIDGADSDLWSYYNQATAYISASKAEGFGIPILEAFKLNCPVICSSIPAYMEVASEAAQYFSPSDADEMVEVLNQFLQGTEQKLEQRQKRLTEYSWVKSANSLSELYTSLLV